MCVTLLGCPSFVFNDLSEKLLGMVCRVILRESALSERSVASAARRRSFSSYSVKMLMASMLATGAEKESTCACGLFFNCKIPVGRGPTAEAVTLESQFSRDLSPALSPGRKAKSPVDASNYFAAGSYFTAHARFPSVSRNLTIQQTPGIAVFGITILPPLASMARAAASTSST